MAKRDIEAGSAFVRLYLKGRATLTRNLRMVMGQVKKIGIAAAAGVAALAGTGVVIGAGLVKIANDAAKVGDEFNKMSDRTSISVESLSRLGFAAKQSGVDMKTLEDGVFRMNRRVANAATEMGPAQRALEMLNINAADFAKVSPEEQMIQLADALNGMENQALAAQIGYELFGKSFQTMRPLLKQGAEGIKELTKQSDELGHTWSKDSANAATEYVDALSEFETSITAIKNKIGVALLPALTSIVDRMTPVVASIGEWIDKNKGLLDSFDDLKNLGDLAYKGLVLGWERAVFKMSELWIGLIRELKIAWIGFSEFVTDKLLDQLDSLAEMLPDKAASFLGIDRDSISQTRDALTIGSAALRSQANDEADLALDLARQRLEAAEARYNQSRDRFMGGGNPEDYPLPGDEGQAGNGLGDINGIGEAANVRGTFIGAAVSSLEGAAQRPVVKAVEKVVMEVAMGNREQKDFHNFAKKQARKPNNGGGDKLPIVA